jgi:hypothetical protein
MLPLKLWQQNWQGFGGVRETRSRQYPERVWKGSVPYDVATN